MRNLFYLSSYKKTFKASAERIYNAWLSSDEHSQMTGGEADITA